jgi:succinate dehydrogenase/fumarate reductase flavoprotein subunit
LDERCELIKRKNELKMVEDESWAKIKNKQSEVTEKENEIRRLKKEKDSSEIALNESIRELRKDLNTVTQQNKGNIERINLLTKQLDEFKALAPIPTGK